ncbi:MAG: carboxypeptidase-like regulatory domain-containing protein, partial [Muribaculaceae bacterium]|nr:carboxypeptidase-like regulatory domain-containing protein [Muribaculaceae bacterium]
MLLSLGSMTGSGVCLASGTYATPLENVGQREHTTYGTIFDSTGEPVIGATVRVKGTSIGTSTDIDGKFSIKASPSATLIISYVGCETKEVKVAASPMSITLNDNTQDLNELVVVGFGTQKKVNLTGAVGVVTSDELAERPVANATQALQGLVPGLNIDINSGSLEKTPSINVRGGTTIGEGTSGSPLILIDGMEGD